jgi:hypothetical protein
MKLAALEMTRKTQSDELRVLELASKSKNPERAEAAADRAFDLLDQIAATRKEIDLLRKEIASSQATTTPAGAAGAPDEAAVNTNLAEAAFNPTPV